MVYFGNKNDGIVAKRIKHVATSYKFTKIDVVTGTNMQSITMVWVLMILALAIPGIPRCSCFVSPYTKQHHHLGRSLTVSTSSKLFGVKSRFQFAFEEDFYSTLNVTRNVERSEIRKNYRTLAREWHPDVFVDELRFKPEDLSVKDLKSYLDQERAGILGVTDKQDLVLKVEEVYKRSGTLPGNLQVKRQKIQDRFALLNEAYNTLYDQDSRRIYDLSGDWGIPGKSGKTTTDGGMGDRAEAARVRERGQASQRNPMQERMYQKYQKEKAEKDKEEIENRRKRAEIQARTREEARRKIKERALEQELYKQEREEKKIQQIEYFRRLDEIDAEEALKSAKKKALEQQLRETERALLGLKSKKDMTDEEIREANQNKIKGMWGNIFNGRTKN